LGQLEAAKLLGMGERTFRRLCRRYEEDGEAGLLDHRLFAIVWACPNLQQIMTEFEPVLVRRLPNPYPWSTWRPDTRWAVVCGAIEALGVLASAARASSGTFNSEHLISPPCWETDLRPAKTRTHCSRPSWLMPTSD
jgi:hypothetical protein